MSLLKNGRIAEAGIERLRFSQRGLRCGFLSEVLLRGHMAAVVHLEGFEEIGAVFLQIRVGDFAGLAFLSFGCVRDH